MSGWHALPDGVGYDFETHISALAGPATFWAEALEPETAETLARYSTGPFDGRAALTVRELELGKVFYVGWYPTLGQARALLANLATESGVSLYPDLPEGLIVQDRGRYWVGLNFSERPLRLELEGDDILVGPRQVVIRS